MKFTVFTPNFGIKMDAAAIEEANKLRVSMGMKPLPVPGAPKPKPQARSSDSSGDEDDEPASTLESREAKAYENYKRVQDADKAKKRREEKAAAVKKAREAAQRHAVLEGKGLGDLGEDEDVGAKSWLKGQKKRQKKLEKTKLEEQKAAEAAAAAASAEYGAKDLAGVKVAHEISSFLDGDEQVLTLKDTTVLENEEEGDELENLNLREKEKLDDRLKLKKKRPLYDPNDIDESGAILAQYDEEIHGKKKKLFTLDAEGTLADLDAISDAPREKRKLQNLDIDILRGSSLLRARLMDNAANFRPEDVPTTSDYFDISEIKVKKPKKKKTKSTRQRLLDDDDILFPADDPTTGAVDDLMEVDSGPGSFTKKRKVVDETFVDDDDLQASLALQRRNALKKRKRARPEDIAKQLREEAPSDDENNNDARQNGGLVIDEISGFVDTLKKPGEDDERKPKAAKAAAQASVTTMRPDSSDEDEDMKDAAATNEEFHDRESSAPADLPTAGVEEEKTIGQGLGAALQLLRERGLIKESSGDDKNEQFREKQMFLAERHRRLAQMEQDTKLQRERDRASGRLDRMQTRDREDWQRQQNSYRDQQASRMMADLFNQGYKPNVELKYTDEFGRNLDQKEAFKHLSHMFHGKGSGKGKTDKRLKKIEDEKRRESQSILDASQNVGMSSATAQQLKKRKEAGVRLA